MVLVCYSLPHRHKKSTMAVEKVGYYSGVAYRVSSGTKLGGIGSYMTTLLLNKTCFDIF